MFSVSTPDVDAGGEGGPPPPGPVQGAAGMLCFYLHNPTMRYGPLHFMEEKADTREVKEFAHGHAAQEAPGQDRDPKQPRPA